MFFLWQLPMPAALSRRRRSEEEGPSPHLHFRDVETQAKGEGWHRSRDTSGSGLQLGFPASTRPGPSALHRSGSRWLCPAPSAASAPGRKGLRPGGAAAFWLAGSRGRTRAAEKPGLGDRPRPAHLSRTSQREATPPAGARGSAGLLRGRWQRLRAVWGPTIARSQELPQVGAEVAARLPGPACSMPETRTQEVRIKRCGTVYTPSLEDANRLLTWRARHVLAQGTAEALLGDEVALGAASGGGALSLGWHPAACEDENPRTLPDPGEDRRM